MDAWCKPMRPASCCWRFEGSVISVVWLRFGLLGIEQSDLKTHAPGRCSGRMHGVAVEACRDVDRLIPEAHDASRAAAKGYRPYASAGRVVSGGRIAGGLTVPVRGDDRR